MLKNYLSECSPTIKKLSLWLRTTIGTLAVSAYAQSEVRLGFWLLVAGAVIDGLLQFLPPDQDGNSGDKPNAKKAIVVAAMLLAALIGFSGCKIFKTGSDHSKTDSTETTYKQVDLHIKGAKVFAGINMDSLYRAMLFAKDQRLEDSLARLNMDLNYKQDSIAALKANKPIPPKPVYVPSPPKKQYITDPKTKAQLSYWIDAYGRFQMECEAKDQTIQTLQAEVKTKTKEVTTLRELVNKTPTWNWIAIAVLATLLVISLLINFINRKSSK